MESRRFITSNEKTVIAMSDGSAELVIPTEVPFEVVEILYRRFRDRMMRPVAWKRRNAREELRESRRHRRQRVERHIPLRAARYRRRGARGHVKRRFGLPAWTRHMTR